MKFILKYAFVLSVLLTSCVTDDEDDDVALNEIGLNDITLTVSEDAEVGSTIGEINLTNASSLTVSTSIESGNEDGIFSLENTTLTLEKSLDFETSENHTLVIEASANGQTVSGTVTINVTDVEEEGFSLNGITYELEDGIILDYGVYAPLEVESHYNYDFFIADASISYVNEDFIAPDARIIVYAELLSPSTTSFQAGLFNYTSFNEDIATEEDVDGKYVFDYVSLILLTDEEEIEIDQEYLAVDGTVLVVDNGNNNYTLEFNITVQQYDEDTETFDPSTEQTVSFSYTGSFQYYDDRD